MEEQEGVGPSFVFAFPDPGGPEYKLGPYTSHMDSDLATRDEFDTFRDAWRGRWDDVIGALCKGLIRPTARSGPHTLLVYALTSAPARIIHFLIDFGLDLLPGIARAFEVARINPTMRSRCELALTLLWSKDPTGESRRVPDAHLFKAIQLGKYEDTKEHFEWLLRLFPDLKITRAMVNAARDDRLKVFLVGMARWSPTRAAWLGMLSKTMQSW